MEDQNLILKDQSLILVDEKNSPSGKYAPKRVCHSGKGLTHLAFTILVLNNKNEVLLQHRKHKLWDHFWDLTNSHPLNLREKVNETIEQAVSRCLKREWGGDFPTNELFSLRYFAKHKNKFCENEYCVFLLGHFDGEVCPSSEVAYGFKWILLNELMLDVKNHPRRYTPWLVRGINELAKRKLP